MGSGQKKRQLGSYGNFIPNEKDVQSNARLSNKKETKENKKEYCAKCGKPCGQKYPAYYDWKRGRRFYCEDCHRNSGNGFLTVVYLAFSAVITGVFFGAVVYPIEKATGHTTSVVFQIASVIGCIVLHFFLKKRVLASTGCLKRASLKLADMSCLALIFGLIVLLIFFGGSIPNT